MTAETATASAPIRARREADRLVVTLEGNLTGETVTIAEPLFDAVVREGEGVRELVVDGSRLDRFDTLGGVLVERLDKAFRDRGAAVTFLGFPDTALRLYGEVRSELSLPVAELPAARSDLYRGLNRIGRAMVGAGRDLVNLVAFFGQVMVASGRVLTGRGRFRLAAVITQIDHVAFRAVPIIFLITFLIGAIIAQQGIFHFRRFGADTFVAEMVGVLVLREIGVLLVAIMVAGRTGSAVTAELGSMKMNEEVDALKVMGLSPIEVLVLPRLIALVIGLPLLTMIGNLSALAGGAVVAQYYGNIPMEIFFSRIQDEISNRHVWVGLSKAPFMALIIGIVACIEGFAVKGSAESLGSHTTSSVVKAIFLVIIIDALFAVFYASIGW